MSVPAPPYPPGYLGKTLVQRGGPKFVESGYTTAAITFGTAFPAATYQTALEWVSGSWTGNPSYGFRQKTVDSELAVFDPVTEKSAFNWRCWRIA